jgi:hypothetical protein
MSADMKLIPFRGAVSDNGVVSVKLIRQFSGGVALELGVQFIATYETQDELSDIFTDALSTLNEEMRVQVARMAQSSSSGGAPLQPNDPTATIDDDGYHVIDVTSIAVEIKGDKRLYKVKGGKYEKYGVRVWLDSSVISESFKQQIERAQPDGTGHLRMMNTKASIQVVNDRPTKVMKLWRVE